MRIEPAPDRYLYPQIEYGILPESTTEMLCSADIGGRSFRGLREAVLIIDGHPYRPVHVPQHDIWRTPRTHRTGREAAA